jgi:hypothetical protein
MPVSARASTAALTNPPQLPHETAPQCALLTPRHRSFNSAFHIFPAPNHSRRRCVQSAVHATPSHSPNRSGSSTAIPPVQSPPAPRNPPRADSAPPPPPHRRAAQARGQRRIDPRSIIRSNTRASFSLGAGKRQICSDSTSKPAAQRGKSHPPRLPIAASPPGMGTYSRCAKRSKPSSRAISTSPPQIFPSSRSRCHRAPARSPRPSAHARPCTRPHAHDDAARRSSQPPRRRPLLRPPGRQYPGCRSCTTASGSISKVRIRCSSDSKNSRPVRFSRSPRCWL